MSFWHNLVDIELEKKMVDNNCFPRKLSVYDGPDGVRNDVLCDNILDTFADDVLPNLNIYDVYRKCYIETFSGLGVSDRMESVMIGDELKTYKKGFTPQEYTPWIFETHPVLKRVNKEIFPPCVSGKGISTYLNRPDVMDDLNIKYPPVNYQTWDLCTDRIDYTRSTEGSI